MDTPRLRPAGTPITAAAASVPIRREALLSIARERWPLVALTAIMALAAAVRLFDLVENPPGFFADEASYGYNAYTILHSGKDEYGSWFPLFFKAFGEYKLPIYTYSIVPFIAALGLNELAIRLTSALYGILTIGVLYLFVKALFKNEAVALLSAAMLAILPWHIHYSRTGLGEIIVFPFFLTLSLYLFIQGTRKPAFLLWAGLSFGLTLYSYRAAWVILPIVLPILGALYWRELWRFRTHALLAVATIALLALPIALHILSVDTDRAQEESIFKLDLGMWGTFERFLSNYRELFTRHFLLEGYGENNLRHAIPRTGWLYWWQVPFIILGTAALFWQPTRAKVLVLVLLAVFPIPSAVTTFSPGSARSIWGTVAFSIVTAYGVYVLAQLVSFWTVRVPKWQPVGLALSGIVVTGVVAYAVSPFSTFMETYHGRYEETSQDFWGWQWGARNLIDHFRDVDDEYDELVMDSTFNAPEIFPMFYAPNGCDKCIIGHWDKYNPGTKQLFGLRAETAWMTFEYDVKGQVYYPTGTLAFVFVEINGAHNTVPGMLPMAPNATASDFEGVPGDIVNALAMFNQANDAWQVTDIQTALDRYNASLGAAPTFALGFYNRGNLFAAFGMLESAISDYGVALQYDDSYNAAHANMGNAFLLLGRYDEAKTALDAAIARDQTLATAFAARGTTMHGLGQDQEAINDLDAAIRLDPNLAIAYARRGSVFHALGNAAQAIADHTRAMELDPKLVDAYTGRADSLLAQQDYPLAMADLNRAVEIDRDNGTAYGLRGVAAIYTGDLELAQTDLAKAVDLDRMYARASTNAHNPYWKVQDPAELATQLEAALALVDDTSIKERLAVSLEYLRARA